MNKISRQIIKAINNGNKVFVFGNGGSATMSNHFVGELVGRYLKERDALPAISLTSNIANITAIANDYSYEMVFVRQLQALSNTDDIAIGLSTSGTSPNVLRALSWAEDNGLKAIDFPRVGNTTPYIQEEQLKLIHVICSEVEEAFI